MNNELVLKILEEILSLSQKIDSDGDEYMIRYQVDKIQTLTRNTITTIKNEIRENK